MELYKRYRPKTLKGLVGQDSTVSSLETLIERGLPHCLMLTGPSGCGKTTVARILAREIKCSKSDFTELNAADFKGIDTIRDIRRSINLKPLNGASRVWMIDECHKLTSDAQNAILKMLEDPPEHAFFMLCTTDPQKVIRTVHTRSTQIQLGSLAPLALCKLIKRVAVKESMEVSDKIIKQIAEASEGSGRKALVLLEQVGMLDGDSEQSKAIAATTVDQEQAIELARALFNSRSKWPQVAAILKAMQDQDSENIRYCVLGYARSVLLNATGERCASAAAIIDFFSEPTYNSKHAGLAFASWNAFVNR